MKRKLYGIAAIIIVIVEFVLCFVGPMAFTTKVGLMVAPFYQGVHEGEELSAVENYFNKVLANTGAYDIKTPRMVEDLIEAKNLELDKIGRFIMRDEYLDLAAGMEIPRLLTVNVYGGVNGGYTYSLNFYNTDPESREGNNGPGLRRVEFETADLLNENPDDIMVTLSVKGRFEPDKKPLMDEVTLTKRSYNLFDLLFFFILGLQLLFAVLILLGKLRPGILEIFILPLLLMGMFAFIYALGANMDYVHRFIAESGGLNIAQDTATEQLYSLIRFLPLLLINLAVYIHKGIKRHAGWANHFSTWALPYTILSAVLYVLAFPSGAYLEGFGVLGFVCYVPLLLVFMQSSKKRSFYYGILFFVLQGILLNYWQSTYGYVSLPSVTVIFFIQAALAMSVLVLIVKFAGRRGWLMFPVWLVVFEFARSWGYIGYPWGYLGVSQYYNVPFIQVADITGILGVTFLTALFNLGAAGVLLYRNKSIKYRVLALGSVSLCLLAMIYGTVQMNYIDNRPSEKSRILLIQQSTDPRKHEVDQTINTAKELTLQALNESPDKKVDLVVWSEGGIPKTLHRSIKYGDVKNAIKAIQDRNMYFTFGTYDSEKDENGEVLKFNSSTFLAPADELEPESLTFYHKRHLVPFTEYFPYKEELPWLYAILDKFNVSDWTPGDDALVFEHPRFKFFTPICFEDVFSDDLRDFTLQGAQLIVNMSNDYWSLSPVEGFQHGIHALFRSVENHIPTVRSTASGMTVAFDAAGRITAGPAPFYEPAYLWADVKIAEPELTLYASWGDWFPWCMTISMCMLLLYLIGAAVYKRVKRKLD